MGGRALVAEALSRFARFLRALFSRCCSLSCERCSPQLIGIRICGAQDTYLGRHLMERWFSGRAGIPRRRSAFVAVQFAFKLQRPFALEEFIPEELSERRDPIWKSEMPIRSRFRCGVDVLRSYLGES